MSVSHISLVTPQLVRLLDASEGAPPPAELRAVLLGGGPIPEALVSRRWRPAGRSSPATA